MSLARYRRKRNFKVTPEPSGKPGRSGSRLRFVIQKHAARRLHYDFRLELDGTLKSWAVPKGPSLDPADKRLAVHVEDHPLEYGRFEGIIPEQQYGAGAVIVWDRGTWIPLDDPRRAYREGRLKFELAGKKLHGGWNLVRMNGRAAAGKENWLLIKERDAQARPGAGARLVEEEPASVASGRTVEALQKAPGKARIWNSGKRRAAKTVADRARAAKTVADRTRAAKPAAESAVATHALSLRAPLPDRIEPQLATLVDTPPADEGWAYEIKFDGYRLLARIERGKARLLTRTGLDWTAKFPGIARDLARLKVKSGWLDGEACVIDGRGRSSFSALQRALSGETRDEPAYLLFDVLFLDGADLRGLPWRERKGMLKRLLAGAGRRSTLRYSDDVKGSGAAALAQACKLGLEGLIGKRLDASYVSGHTRDWIKLKCRQRQEFVIGGYTPPQGARTGFGALLLGVYEKDGLRYAGRVGTGFNEARLKAMYGRLRGLEAGKSPFSRLPHGISFRNVKWVKPQLIAEVTFAEWTHDGHVRQASFEGLREDKPARQIGRERPVKTVKSAPARPVRSAAARAEGNTVAGITITHPERVVYPEAKLTKLDVALYYERIAAHLLPYVRNRPLSVVRCPSGSRGGCFFQKHPSARDIPGIETAMIKDSEGRNPYILANTVEALVGLAQMGTIELHAWNATMDDIEHPDMFVIDFDPDAGLPWRQVVDAARAAHVLFDRIGLESFLKTTGGKGLHVVVPLTPGAGWDEVKEFSRAVALRLVDAFPERFTAVASKARRKGKIFVDYLRNGRGATAVAPYSVRARPGATVAMPLAWKDLTPSLRPGAYTIATLDRYLKRRDPWAQFSGVRQSITQKMKRSVG